MTKKNEKKYIGAKEYYEIQEPTLTSNLEKTAAIGIQAANNKVSSALNMVANTLNVDPNASASIIVDQLNERLKNINDAFQSPEGRQILSELGELASKLIKTTEEPLKEGQRVFNQMLTEQLRSFEKLAWGAIGLVPFVGDISEVIRIAKDLFQAFIKTMKAVSGVSLEASKTLEDVKNTIDEKSNLFVRMAEVMQNTVTDSNKQVNEYLTMASNDLADQAKYIAKEQKDISKKLKMNNVLNMNKIRKGGARMTKRTHKSIERFLSSRITASHIKRKYSMKRRSRRHHK